MASKDRLGWLTRACEYIEFSFDGVEVGRYGCPGGYSDFHQIGGVGLSPANDLVIGASWATPLGPLELDRATSTWKRVPVLEDSGTTRRILGFDGLTLMTSSGFVFRQYGLSNSVAGGH
jgi:hypothetical protein